VIDSQPMTVLIDYNEATMVMTVTLNRESRGNALSPAMFGELLALFSVIRNTFQMRVMHEAPLDDRGRERKLPIWLDKYKDVVVRALVLTGAGKVFCSGMDLRAAATTPAAPNNADATSGSDPNTEQLLEFFESLQTLPMPTVCMLNGPALGGGTAFLFVCDFAFMPADSYIQFSEVKIGMIPALISCFIVPRAGATAVRYMISGQRWTAPELARCSFATAVPTGGADASALRSTVDAFVCDNLLTSSSRATAAIKRLAAHVSAHSHSANRVAASSAFRDAISSSDVLYGISCFNNKQRADWQTHLKSKL